MNPDVRRPEDRWPDDRRPTKVVRRTRVLVSPLVLAGLLALGACAGSGERDVVNDSRPVEVIYNAGADALQAQDYQRATALFDTVERQYPYSPWAVNAKLMAAFSEYQRNRYTEAIGALDRFIALHPAHKDVPYAYYLRALSLYEQIAQVERDQRTTGLAMNALQEVVTRFPDTPYARDARLKIDLARDHLAGKEMAVGRWYQGRKLYSAAINRYRRVVSDYQTTNHVPEALHRMTESYLALGLRDEATKTAAVLGHNFPDSPWYRDSYSLVETGQVADAAGPGILTRWWDGIF